MFEGTEFSNLKQSSTKFFRVTLFFNTYIVGYHFVIRINEIRMMGITIDDRHAQNSKWKSTQSNFLSPSELHRLDDSKNDAEVNFAPNSN